MQEEKKQCDVLCVGGGIVGLMAAIRAAEMGANVIVAEKSNTLRSGSGGTGNDHFHCYIPEVHGTFESFMKELYQGQVGPMRKMGAEFVEYYMKHTFEILKLWDDWGIPMKYKGKYEFAGHGFPGKKLNFLKYAGKDQKPVLTRQALKRGAKIMNRVMVFDLLTDKDGSVCGSIGISTREDKVIVFEAKSVILGTGGCIGVYPSATVGADNNRGYPLAISGDGLTMAYRAGAKLKDIELTGSHAGPKYFVRSGQATWVGVLRDISGKPVGPFVTKPDIRYGDMTIEVDKSIFDKYKQSGQGPIYMDMNGISKKDLEYMVYWLKNEGNEGLLNHIAEEGIDFGKSAIEFQTFPMDTHARMMANFRGETGVKGLYAAGDEVMEGISNAAVIGWSAGENATKYVNRSNPANIEVMRSEIDSKQAMLEEIRNRKEGASWSEAVFALQQIMSDYCGKVRSESLLSAGLKMVRRLKNKAHTTLMAENMHDLMNCLQALNKIDLGELTFISASDRQETRNMHIRADYPLTNPLLSDKIHIIKQVNGQPVTEWVVVE